MTEFNDCAYQHEEDIKKLHQLYNTSQDEEDTITANRAIETLYENTCDEEQLNMKKKLLRLWPDEPSRLEIQAAKERIQSFQTKMKYKHDLQKRLEDKTKRKPLMEEKTKKEKTAALLKLKNAKK